MGGFFVDFEAFGPRCSAQVFGKGNVAGRERARNELERIRREEGGVIDRYEWEEFVEENAKSDPGVPSCP